jgi:hypothetical protein
MTFCDLLPWANMARFVQSVLSWRSFLGMIGIQIPARNACQALSDLSELISLNSCLSVNYRPRTTTGTLPVSLVHLLMGLSRARLCLSFPLVIATWPTQMRQ